MSERELRESLAEAAHRLYQRGLVVAYEGNLSGRLCPGARPSVDRRGAMRPEADFHWLCSPSRRCKGELAARDFLRVDGRGRALSQGELSSEWELHLGIYRHLPEAVAVIHAHPPHATAFACTAGGLAPLLQPELIQLLGAPVPLAPYAPPGSAELFASVRPLLATCAVVLLANHGLVAVSRHSVGEAFHFVEQVEQVARITHLALGLGAVRPLSGEQIRCLR